MTIAIDTNILLDILLPDPDFKNNSLKLLKKYTKRNKLIVSGIVYGELSLQFNNKERLDKFLLDTNITLVNMSRKGYWISAQAWKEYLKVRDRGFQCSKCGKKEVVKCGECNRIITARQFILSDFLIGGHAITEAGKLMTRDRGFYRNYFHKLDIVSHI